MSNHPGLNHYKKISVTHLSDNQKRKLMKGEGVRVKHGSGEEIHVSKEQHKKLMKAYENGNQQQFVLTHINMKYTEALSVHGLKKQDIH